MKKFRTTKAVGRLSILLAILVPLVFIGVVMLRNQKIPAGFEIIKFGGIMLAIAVAVWLSIRITALLANVLIDWFDKLLSKGHEKRATDNENEQSNGYKSKIIDAEIVEEEVSDGVWQKSRGENSTKAEPDWAKATSDPHLALSLNSGRTNFGTAREKLKKKRKRVVGPPSRLTKTIMVIIAFAILFALISNLMSDEWLTLLAPVPGLWAIISLWRIWDPKNAPSKPPGSTEDQKHS